LNFILKLISEIYLTYKFTKG